ncbi:helix-turn-helix domain-containing protein [Veillonella denticariosi JCM 15641]|uniref:Helix-turn-helix domain-containing protein n=1 Tax=Veillonella denticariosi JCM 15641 TaxID=1298594 RepID=A0A2S7ZCV9_9FIRM|nr:helix-turn-helix transcriptional regulator [Veillonella denticariosi]PQL20957.1 helix-turn-helix domain-containing protein [Veillonella denticariosi JCM 15641]
MANKIKLYRTMLGLSQHELAEKVGVTRATINSIENGKTIPSLKLANDIAVVLGRSINDVFHTLN